MELEPMCQLFFNVTDLSTVVTVKELSDLLMEITDVMKGLNMVLMEIGTLKSNMKELL
ncbi:hypothetical protein UFB30_01390 [Jeotgalibacillus sp. HH7-29]|uniref:Uncharacterized protein n=2 Tax=Jeotgalibacillus haloalkalitolerans TaxID=3104292 RepID=A0ABU5KI71_9BACL|nr:hypothetical protein [Jeotgalibacillus sp. HH7-29]